MCTDLRGSNQAANEWIEKVSAVNRSHSQHVWGTCLTSKTFARKSVFVMKARHSHTECAHTAVDFTTVYPKHTMLYGSKCQHFTPMFSIDQVDPKRTASPALSSREELRIGNRKETKRSTQWLVILIVLLCTLSCLDIPPWFPILLGPLAPCGLLGILLLGPCTSPTETQSRTTEVCWE